MLTLLTNATLIDCVQPEAVEGAAVLIENGRIREICTDGSAPAAFICESVYGNAGGMALPDGYLQQVYAAVRAAGGLAISDEVQVGYGRLGEWFWGFMQQDAVPDIVSIAKSAGNGYPLGAVITNRAVADGFVTLRKAGLAKVLEGVTTLDEVRAATLGDAD